MRSSFRRPAARLRLLAAAAVGAFGALTADARAAHAQPAGAPPTATLRFDVAGAPAFTSPYGAPDVGRLQGTFLSLPGQPDANVAVDLFCIDILHNVTFRPEGWQVYLTNLGGAPSLDYTRQGARYATTTPDALTRYRKAAWLVDQFSTVTSLVDTAGIQGAMWLQFEPSLAPYDYANAGEQQSVGSWLAAANAFQGSAGWDGYDWSRFTVVTDVNAAGLGNDWHGMQELIMAGGPTTTTPEPATVVLLAAGAGVVGVVARRRQRAAQ